MAVSNGQIANQTTFNNAYLSKTQDSSTVGIVGLLNTNPISGATVANPQREINGVCAYTGRALGAAFNSTPTYSSEFIVTNGDDLVSAIGKLDAEHSPTTGSLAARAGRETLSSGVSTASVTFGAAWPDTDFILCCSIENTVDTDPIFLQHVVTVRSTTGFSVLFNAQTDSANYVLNWAVRKAA